MLTRATWARVSGLRHGFLERGDAPPCDVALPRQVHGTRVLTLEPRDDRPDADGLVVQGVAEAVGIQTADCMPVLIVERTRRVAGAVHAGWRGAAAGILEAALAHLRADFGVASDAVEVAIGPTVGPCCYEVGPEVRDAFQKRTRGVTDAAFAERDGRLRLDLRRAATALLEAAGVTADRTVAVGPCTSCDRRFASYRRDGTTAGRQVSFVGWT